MITKKNAMAWFSAGLVLLLGAVMFINVYANREQPHTFTTWLIVIMAIVPGTLGASVAFRALKGME